MLPSSISALFFSVAKLSLAMFARPISYRALMVSRPKVTPAPKVAP